jgi:sporulation protein YlmC with PRC-barrel domain
MTKTFISMTTALAAALLCYPAAAAQHGDAQQQGRLVACTDLKTAQVHNQQNENIGSINEVLVDPNTGDVRYAIIGVGGFLGIGTTDVGVPWEAVQVTHQGNDKRVVLDASRDRLQNAPRVEGRNFDRLFTREGADQTHQYWGVTARTGTGAQSPSAGQAAAQRGTGQGAQTGQVGQAGPQTGQAGQGGTAGQGAHGSPATGTEGPGRGPATDATPRP